MELLAKMDTALLLWLNGWVAALPWLDNLIQFLASDYLVPVVLSLFILGMWFGPRSQESRMRSQRAALGAMTGMGLSSFAVAILNEFFFRPRPFETFHLHLLFYHASDSSFPMQAAAIGFGFAVGIWTANRKLGAIACVLAGLWGIARVIAGASYPSDMLAGALIGFAITNVVFLFFRLYDPFIRFILRMAQYVYLA
ncbi:MAG: phosphatase PAP2 family protein [Dehalococcoidia bacterium]|nr:phosphatase PAP2 family protein [Dehalococcoidia bacterium]